MQFSIFTLLDVVAVCGGTVSALRRLPFVEGRPGLRRLQVSSFGGLAFGFLLYGLVSVWYPPDSRGVSHPPMGSVAWDVRNAVYGLLVLSLILLAIFVWRVQRLPDPHDSPPHTPSR